MRVINLQLPWAYILGIDFLLGKGPLFGFQVNLRGFPLSRVFKAHQLEDVQVLPIEGTQLIYSSGTKTRHKQHGVFSIHAFKGVLSQVPLHWWFAVATDS